jgi:hypothetical protein
LDLEHKLVVAVVPGRRTAENTETLVAEFRRRTGGRLMNLMTSDDYSAYETAILHAYGETITPPRTGKPGRPQAPRRVPPPGLTYATVTKKREQGRVVEIGRRIVFGTIAAVLLALGASKVSQRSTRRSSSGRTARTVTATRGRRGRPTASRSRGGITRRSPT